MELYHGQRLICKNGEEVIVEHIIEGILTVEYKGKLYQRPLSIVGEKLFVKETDEKKKKEPNENNEPTNQTIPSNYSSQKTPLDYKPPWSKIPGHWPKKMEGPYGRFSHKRSK